MPDLGFYYAAGLYGQYIFVSPQHDLVAVFTSGYGAGDVDENPSMFRNYILDAVTEGQQGFQYEMVVPVVIALVVLVPVVVFVVRSRFRSASI